LQKEGIQHLAKSYSYKYCEYYEEIPIFLLFFIAGAKELMHILKEELYLLLTSPFLPSLYFFYFQ
jgi:hypothetical protein